MNRLLAILLIPFFAMGNSLAHSHGVAAHHSTTKTQPHIHIGSGSHHHHHASHEHPHHGRHAHNDDRHQNEEHRQNHDGSDSLSCVKVDHDSDAVYFFVADGLFTTGERCCLIDDVQVVSVSAASVDRRGDVLQQYSTQALQHGSAGRPLYLLHAALRL